MSTRHFVPFARLLLAITLLFLGIGQCIAQSHNTTKPKPPVTSSSGKWLRDPSQVMPMRAMTDAQRRAAATRNTTRKLAAGHKNQAVQKTPRGVK